MHPLSNVHHVEQNASNRSNHKLQTEADNHSTQRDDIWVMVLSTASFTRFSNQVYIKFRQRINIYMYISSLDKVYAKFRQNLDQVYTKLRPSLDRVQTKFGPSPDQG